MGDEDQAPTSPIKPRPWPSGAVVPQRVRRTRRQEASEARARSLNPRPTPAQAPGAPASPPLARRGSYRNSAAAQRRDAPRGGPGSQDEREGPGGRGRGRKGEEIRETSHAGEPDKLGPGRAGAAARAEPSLGPREWGAGPRAGGDAPPRRLGTRVERPGAPGPVRSGSAGLPVTRHPRPPAPGALPPRRGLRPRPRPRPGPQTPAGTRERGEARRAGGGRQLRTGGRGVGLPGARRPGWPGREASGWAAQARLDGPAPLGQHRPLRAPPPPSRSPHPRPGSSTQTFRPARSLLRARRLPLQPGSFRTFRPAPSPRPPFPGPPRGSLGPGGAARPERPRELGPGSAAQRAQAQSPEQPAQ
ncbi:hypothetical protein H8959_009551 [Pygathrix nigripes]